MTDKGYKIETAFGKFDVMADVFVGCHYFSSKKPFPGSEKIGDRHEITLRHSNIVDAKIGDEIMNPEGSIGVLISKEELQ